jgi:hypothetical protein
MADEPVPSRQHWFGKTNGRLGFGPTTREGRVITALYVLLLVVAVFTYSEIFLTVFVVLFYTLVFGLVIVAKSSIMTDRE